MNDVATSPARPLPGPARKRAMESLDRARAQVEKMRKFSEPDGVLVPRADIVLLSANLTACATELQSGPDEVF